MLLKRCVFLTGRNFELDVVGAPFPMVVGYVLWVEGVCIYDLEEFRFGCSGCFISIGWVVICVVERLSIFGYGGIRAGCSGCSISIGGWPFLCC